MLSAFGVDHGISKNLKTKYQSLDENDKDKVKVAGTAAGIGTAIYGRKLGMAGLALRNASKFTDDVARQYGVAASSFKGKPPITGQHTKEQREFIRSTPGAKNLVPTARRWEGTFKEHKKIKEAKDIRGVKNVLLHPNKTRRGADRRIIETGVRNGSDSPRLYRGVATKQPIEEFPGLSSWTPNKAMATQYGANAQRMGRAPKIISHRFNIPDEQRGGTGRIYHQDGVKSLRLGPVSTRGHDEHVVRNARKQ